MKKNLLLVGMLFMSVLAFGQTKIVDMATGAAGTLADKIVEADRSGLKELTITGEIDARDFKLMRDLLPALEKLNIEEANIVAYSGEEGTSPYEGSQDYESNHIPMQAFYDNRTLSELIFPQSITYIDYYALYNSKLVKIDLSKTALEKINGLAISRISDLVSVSLPATIIWISENAFQNSGSITSFTCNVADPTTIQEGVYGMFGIEYKYDYDKNEWVYDDDGNRVIESISNAPEGCTLYVPVGSVDKYKAAETWKTFKTIKEIGAEDKKDPAVSFAESAMAKKTTDGRFINPLTNTDNVTIAYSSSVPTVATVDAVTGEVTIVAAGETVITATTTATDVFNAIEITYTLTVAAPADGISVETAGTLASKIADADRATLKELTITGKLDARDFKFIRDLLPALERLNIEGIDLERYTGQDGTYVFGEGEKIEDINYAENELPKFALNGKATLTEIVFPTSIFCVHQSSLSGTGIKKADFTATALGKIDGGGTFSGCLELESIILPATMEWITSRSFSNNGKLKAFTCLSANPAFITDGFKGMFEAGNAPEGCTLYVPAEGVEAFKAAEDWKIFSKVKAIGSKEDPTVSFAEATVTKTAIDAKFINLLTNTDGVAVAYASSVPEVATIDAQTGEVTILAVGETVIKATTTATDFLNSIEVSYVLTVTLATPTFEYAVGAVTKNVGDAVFTNELTETTDGDVTYASSAPTVATVNTTTGEITILTTGTATITATAVATTKYAAATATYTLTVQLASGMNEMVSAVRVYAVDGGAQVEFENEAIVEAYAANGTLLQSVKAVDGCHIPLGQGIYIIRVNGVSYKITK